jgi:protein involved in polysaccharide export with SLBB domain
VQDDSRILDAVASAGGFANRCDIRHIFVLREHGDSFERIELDLRQFKEEVDETQNIFLQDRDIIFIPEVGRVDWDKVLQTLQQSSMVFYDFRRTLDY